MVSDVLYNYVSFIFKGLELWNLRLLEPEDEEIVMPQNIGKDLPGTQCHIPGEQIPRLLNMCIICKLKSFCSKYMQWNLFNCISAK